MLLPFFLWLASLSSLRQADFVETVFRNQTNNRAVIVAKIFATTLLAHCAPPHFGVIR
jgi:hypothetical protein